MTQKSKPLTFDSIEIGSFYKFYEIRAMVYDGSINSNDWIGLNALERHTFSIGGELVLILNKTIIGSSLEILCYSLEINKNLVIFGLNERLIGDSIKEI